MAKKPQYNNDSIVALKEEQRVRQKPAVIFGSDGVDGCEHAVFEIVSNSVDEAREGYGDKIIVTRFADKSIEVQDFGRGLPVDYNNTEKRYNWELVFCELYASGKYDNSSGGSYEFSLGTNGLGLCATQYASEYMEAEIHTGGFKYTLNFKRASPTVRWSRSLTPRGIPVPASNGAPTLKFSQILIYLSSIFRICCAISPSLMRACASYSKIRSARALRPMSIIMKRA